MSDLLESTFKKIKDLKRNLQNTKLSFEIIFYLSGRKFRLT